MEETRKNNRHTSAWGRNVFMKKCAKRLLSVSIKFSVAGRHKSRHGYACWRHHQAAAEWWRGREFITAKGLNVESGETGAERLLETSEPAGLRETEGGEEEKREERPQHG